MTKKRQIVELYESGLSTRAVAERAETSKTTVLSVLRRAGATMRPSSRHY